MCVCGVETKRPVSDYKELKTNKTVRRGMQEGLWEKRSGEGIRRGRWVTKVLSASKTVRRGIQEGTDCEKSRKSGGGEMRRLVGQ